uniref:Transmembrane protein n=1 Tax=Myotis myotis TaxID=51298 RepID=A0A7J7VYR5_MYOMY|nr:hypothetical protein mMyoMyo1_012367 [Myotis myotis]
MVQAAAGHELSEPVSSLAVQWLVLVESANRAQVTKVPTRSIKLPVCFQPAANPIGIFVINLRIVILLYWWLYYYKMKHFLGAPFEMATKKKQRKTEDENREFKVEFKVECTYLCSLILKNLALKRNFNRCTIDIWLC